MKMDKKEIRKYIGKLLNILDIKNNEVNKISDFIERLKDNDQEAYDTERYEEIKERDKYLKEEIDMFLLNNKGE